VLLLDVRTVITFGKKEREMTGVERDIEEIPLECQQSFLLNHRCSFVIIHKSVWLFLALSYLCVKNVFENKKIFADLSELRLEMFVL
jgi:hypothetical protein